MPNCGFDSDEESEWIVLMKQKTLGLMVAIQIVKHGRQTTGIGAKNAAFTIYMN